MTSSSGKDKRREEVQRLERQYGATRILLVEGTDDVFVIAAIRDKFSVEKNFWIKDCDGYDSLLRVLEITLRKSEFERLGVVVDADSDIQARWESLEEICKLYSLQIPKNPEPSGAVVESASKRVGIWLMPNNEQAGALEDLFKHFIPDRDTLLPFVERSLNEIEAEARRVARYPKHMRSKAFVHTWLAWQEEPGLPMGRAITDYAITDMRAAEGFAKWLRHLFA